MAERYDGFISYSHAADDLLAPRLQAGLQRFAKPWWKRRALRIFRDESSLSANPHLWSSITEALDGSEWFVLLLSDEAASSEWVNQEISYWVEHKDQSRILPVVTDGEFGWANGDIDVSSTAAPPALSGVFTEEPRWVDLRWARSDTDLDLSNPRFSDAVADVASAIRGVPKDELESEEVRQHRRTIRTAWAAGVVVLLLGIAATVGAIVAVGQSNEAQDQRDEAQRQTAIAQTERDTAQEERDRADSAAAAEAEARGEAEDQREVAEDSAAEAMRQAAIAAEERDTAQQERDRADEQARIARAEALAAHATAQLDTDPELSVLLASQALDIEARPAAMGAMHTALQQHRTIFTASVAELNELTAVGGLSPDGSLLAVGSAFSDTFDVWDIDRGDKLWSMSTAGEPLKIMNVGFTTDGAELVALVVGDFTIGNPAPAELRVFDAVTGEPKRVIPAPDCTGSKYFPGVERPFYDLTRPLVWVRDLDCEYFETPDSELGLLDPITGTFTALLPIRAFGLSLAGVPTQDASGSRIAVDDAEGLDGRVIDVATGEIIYEYGGGIATLSADGAKLLARADGENPLLELWDIETGELLWRAGHSDLVAPFLFRAWFSEDETLVYGTSWDGSSYVLDAATGFVVHQLRGQTGLQRESVMSADKSRLATFSSDGTARVWDIGSALLSEATSYESWSAPNPLWSGLDAGAGRIAVWVGGHRADSKWQTIVFDTATGEAEMTVPGGPAALSPDGTLLAYRPVTSRSDGGRMMGDVLVVEVDSGEVVAEFDAPCNASFVGGATVGGDGCFGRVDAPEHTRTWQLAFSPAGDLLSMVDGVDTTLMVWDLSTGETVISDRIEGRYPGQVEFRPDGAISVTLFGSLGGGGTRIVHDLTSYTVISEEVLPGGAMGWRFTPDQSLLITHGFSGDLAYGDGADFSLIDRVQAHQGFVSHIAISPNGTMIASASDDGVRVWNIADRSLLSDLGFTGADVRWLHFLDDRRLLLVAPFTESVIVVALDAADLAAAGKAKVTRAFTETECLTYAIDPCPTTLEELRGG